MRYPEDNKAIETWALGIILFYAFLVAIYDVQKQDRKRTEILFGKEASYYLPE